MRDWKMTLTAAALGAASVAAHSAALVVDSVTGKLLGATGVLVANTLYDVNFVDGTCVALFNGCNEKSDFVFTDTNWTLSASDALLDQVLIDTAQGAFDSDPTLTMGCGYAEYCTILTPYYGSPSYMMAGHANNVSAERVDHGIYDTISPGAGYTPTADMGTSIYNTWAMWKLAGSDPQTVPEPAMPALVALALGALAWQRRRRR